MKVIETNDNSIGEYYVEYDEGYGRWCVFHTDKGDGRRFSSWLTEEEAEEDAKERNAQQ